MKIAIEIEISDDPVSCKCVDTLCKFVRIKETLTGYSKPFCSMPGLIGMKWDLICVGTDGRLEKTKECLLRGKL
jgi:hypothetical protein